MKYIILHADGFADRPLQDLGGHTPLQAAATPHLDRLAQAGELGLVVLPSEGGVQGSDAMGVAILGYDPRKYFPGPAPLEAASLGVAVGEHDVVFRCTMVTLRSEAKAGSRPATTELKKLGPHVVMDDATAGLIDTEQARELIEALNEQLGSETIQFYPGSGHRHLMVWVGGKTRCICSDPQRIVGHPIVASLPAGDGAEILRQLMDASLIILRDHPINVERQEASQKPANCIWLWGQGRAPSWPTLTERYGISGTVVSSRDLHRGIGVCAGLDAVDLVSSSEGAGYRVWSDMALRELSKKDLVYLHVGIPDRVLQSSDAKEKISAIEEFDTSLVGPLLTGLTKLGPYRLLVICDPASAATNGDTKSQASYAYCEGPPKQAGAGARRLHEAGAKAQGATSRDATKLIVKLFPRG
jgi:2,3-bisphosphoglycerate-independent phosphoglycerate mutase